MSFGWTDDLSVGVDDLDKDHQDLINIFNAVLETKRFGDNRPQLKEALGRLLHYTREHFIREELYMAKCGFPDLTGHRQEHLYFVEKVAELENDLARSDSMMVRVEMITFLNDWLMKHIQTADAKYKPHMAALMATLATPGDTPEAREKPFEKIDEEKIVRS